DGQVLDEHAGAEGHVRVDVVGERSAQVDRLQVGLDAVVTARPVGVVLGLEAERHLQRQADVHVVVLAERHVEVGRRDRGDHAGVAAVAATDFGAGARAGGAVVASAGLVELGREADRGQVRLELAAVEQAHGGRVGRHDRGVALGAGRAGEGAAQALGTVLLQLEGGSVGVAAGQRAGDAEGQYGNAGDAVGVMHVALSPERRWLLLFAASAAAPPGLPAVELPSRHTTPYWNISTPLTRK